MFLEVLSVINLHGTHRDMIFAFVIWGLTCSSINGDYNEERDRLLNEEADKTIGGDIILTKNELKVNECLMKFKLEETQYAFQNPEDFNMSRHYFYFKDYIEKSTVYKIIKDLPKGAALHVHDMGVLGPDYLLQLTYLDNLYMCSGRYQFIFADNSSRDGCDNWELVKNLRNSSDKAFDSELMSHFTVVVANPAVSQINIRVAWDAFDTHFATITGLLTYRPLWEQYLYDSLKAFREQNIMYVEFRSKLPNLYELNGTFHDINSIALIYQKVFNKFTSDYPDFIGAKVIYSPARKFAKKHLSVFLLEAKMVKKVIGSTLAGFDLAGHEDSESGSLLEFAPYLMEASNDLDYFFHAGETNWYGYSSDENLVDAILIGTKRIGSAYALMKHPRLVEEVIQNGIGLEVNVISNNVLSLVSDVRNHPLALFIANGLPVVLSSDAPGVWDADVISHDFYTAFVAVASRSADLRLLKQLAINSLKYSALHRVDKMAAMNRFRMKWESFMESFQCSDYDNSNEVDSELPTTVTQPGPTPSESR